jgi:hypothetical protein
MHQLYASAKLDQLDRQLSLLQFLNVVFAGAWAYVSHGRIG